MSHYKVVSKRLGARLWHAKAFTTSSNARERTHEALIDNMASKDSLLSVI